MTPSSTNRLKVTPAHSPASLRPSYSPMRSSPSFQTSGNRFTLKHVIGTTCTSPTGFDIAESIDCFAYIAGGAVVVVDVHMLETDQDAAQRVLYSQFFFRARPTALPVFSVSSKSNSLGYVGGVSAASLSQTLRATNRRNRRAPSPRDASLFGSGINGFAGDAWTDSPSWGKTWTSRERIKAATCVALSRDGRFVAVGETGYAPRVLIFGLQDHCSSDIPLISISEHTFGVIAVAWSSDGKYLASLGAANDGFLYIWKIDAKTGAAKLFQHNRCTSFVRGMVWIGSSLLTFGVRHVKLWRLQEAPPVLATKCKGSGDGSLPWSQAQKSLAGRNVLLGSMLEATFSCAVTITEAKCIVCSEAGDVCLLDNGKRQMKLARVASRAFAIDCVSVSDEDVYFGGKSGEFAAVHLGQMLVCSLDPLRPFSAAKTIDGFVAMGFLGRNLVTIDSQGSVRVWRKGHLPLSAHTDLEKARVLTLGHGDPVLGIQQLSRPNPCNADFFTWSASGHVLAWTCDGLAKLSFDLPMGKAERGCESDSCNQLLAAKAASDGRLFFAGDKMGVLRIVDPLSKEHLLETKAHSSDCQDIAVWEHKTKFVVASCGRDRTVQLFHKTSNGSFVHFQTLEFAAKVVQVLIPSQDRLLTCSLDRTLQVYELVSKEGELDAMAAIPSKIISLKASPTSMAVSADERSVFVSLLDRSVCRFGLGSGRLVASFKCHDEHGAEAVALESLVHGEAPRGQVNKFLLGISNTDKSIRMYDAQSGSLLDREWGHTEAIGGVVMLDVDDDDLDGSSKRTVISVGSDGTIMIWHFHLQDQVLASQHADPNPETGASSASQRSPLRRVLSKAELAEFQRSTWPSSTPRLLFRQPSSKCRLSTSSASARTPVAEKQISPTSLTTTVETTSRRPFSSASTSPAMQSSLENHGRLRDFRRPSLPVLNMAATTPSPFGGNAVLRRKKGYSFGSLSLATEQTSRQLRAYRKKLASTDAIAQDLVAELDAELRLTAAALGDRANRSRLDRAEQHSQLRRSLSSQGGREALSLTFDEAVIGGLFDQYSERLVSLLDAKFRLRLSEQDKDALRDLVKVKDGQRPRTATSSGDSASGNEDGQRRGRNTPDSSEDIHFGDLSGVARSTDRRGGDDCLSLDMKGTA